MDFLKQLRKSAQNAAREGLEWLGVNVPQHEIPDDEDTATRDIIDIYREISLREQAPESQALSAVLREKMLAWIESFCGSNRVLLESLEAWLDDCHDISEENLRTEAIVKLQQGGVIRSCGDSSEQWLENIQEIAKTQGRTVFNLLLQAHKQCDLETFDTWFADMNEKLAMFDMRIEKVEIHKMTLVRENN